MKEVLEIDKKNMHAIKVASEATGYSRDYITRLAREGKVVGTQVGRQWYLDLESLEKYSIVAELEQKIRQKHLSQERRQGLEVFEALQKQKAAHEKVIASQNRWAKNSIVFLVVSGFYVSLLLGIFLLPKYSLVSSQYANVSSAVQDKAGEDTSTEFVFGDESSEVFLGTEKLADSKEAILLLPQGTSGTELLQSTNLFSDDTVVRVDESGRTFITKTGPNGELTADEIPFVMVPLAKLKTP